MQIYILLKKMNFLKINKHINLWLFTGCIAVYMFLILKPYLFYL